MFEYNRLFVGNVDNANVTESQIRNIFSQYGTLTKVEVEHGFAFITFESETCSRTALETENGKKYGNRCLCLSTLSSPLFKHTNVVESLFFFSNNDDDDDDDNRH